MRARHASVIVLVIALGVGAWLLNSWRAEGTHPDPVSHPTPETPPLDAVQPVPETGPTFLPVKEVMAETEEELAASGSSIDSPDSLASGVLLYGFVLPPEGIGRLDDSVGVVLTDSHGESRRVEAGPEGEYSFQNLQSGRYWIHAQAWTVGQVRQVIEVEAIAGDRRIDLRLEPESRILVEVVDTAGNMIRDKYLLAAATLESPGLWMDELRGSINNTVGVGAWLQSGQPGADYPPPILGCVRLSVPPPVFISLLHNQRVVATQQILSDQTRARFEVDLGAAVLQPGRLRLRLVDAQSNQALPGLPMLLQTGSAMMSGVTDQDGRYTGSHWPGWMLFNVLGGRYESTELAILIEPGVETDLGDLALELAVSISGKVVDEEGRGVACKVSYSSAESEAGGPSDFFRSVKATSDGSFRIAGLSRRRYHLKFGVEGGAYARDTHTVDARAGSTDDVRLVLVPGTPLVVSASDESWPQVRFALYDAQGEQRITSRLYGPEPRKILVAPGRYELEVRTGEKAEGSRRTLIVGAVPIELALP